MPEVILPCPECGDDECLIAIQELPSEEWSVHCGCGHAGRYCASEEEAIKAHNALPRAMTWTHEPPKVAGWYPWRSGKGQNMTMIQIHVFNGVCGFWDGNGVFITDLNRGEWAGPIPAPID